MQLAQPLLLVFTEFAADSLHIGKVHPYKFSAVLRIQATKRGTLPVSVSPLSSAQKNCLTHHHTALTYFQAKVCTCVQACAHARAHTHPTHMDEDTCAHTRTHIHTRMRAHMLCDSSLPHISILVLPASPFSLMFCHAALGLPLRPLTHTTQV